MHRVTVNFANDYELIMMIYLNSTYAFVPNHISSIEHLPLTYENAWVDSKVSSYAKAFDRWDKFALYMNLTMRVIIRNFMGIYRTGGSEERSVLLISIYTYAYIFFA